MKKILKDLLQELLNETQNEMNTYRQLPEKTRKKKKIMQVYRYLQFRGSKLKEKIGELDKGL